MLMDSDLNIIISKSATELSRECIAEFERQARVGWKVHGHLSEKECYSLRSCHDKSRRGIHAKPWINPTLYSARPGEKNDINTKTFFRWSNHQGDVALCQIVEKQNRIEHLETIGVKVWVFDIHCSNCKCTSHNRLTCTNPCNHCGFVPYCDHLGLVITRLLFVKGKLILLCMMTVLYAYYVHL